MSSTETVPDILSAAFAADPNALYPAFLDEHPLLWHETLQTYVVSRYEDVELAFKDPRFSTKNYEWQLEPVHGPTFMQMDGREHATRRALVAPSFRGRELAEKFQPVIERTARDLAAAFAPDGRADLVGQFATRLPIMVMVDVFGLPPQDHERFHRWYTLIVDFVSSLGQSPEAEAAGLRTRDEIAEYLIPLIEGRRTAPGDDLLSTLTHAEIDGVRMSNVEVKAFVSLLLTAGAETTDKGIGSVMQLLLEHPDQLAAVRADRALVEAAFAESLRHSPMIQMVMRITTEDVDFSGGTVPAGSTVTCLVGAANRDPRRFDRPAEFDVHRPDLDTRRAFSGGADHVGFGLGRHFCVGAQLARAEVVAGVNALLDMAGDLRLADGCTPVRTGLFTRGPERLDVVFTPRPTEEPA
ncbi:cytochrome P450 [Pseudonocardia sp. CNS-139]|nr:cytochrome P450 [Pseudonocardia sp. CNS-139]